MITLWTSSPAIARRTSTKPPRSPHLLKQKTVLEYARRYNLKTLIETGTYYGEMVAAMRGAWVKLTEAPWCSVFHHFTE